MSASAFYVPTETGFRSTPHTAGPWRPDAQHGGPPAALLGRALESLGAGVLGRFTLDLLGPIPVSELTVTAQVLRPGRSVELREATLTDETGRDVARGQGWFFPNRPTGLGEAADSGTGPLPHTAADGRTEEAPSSWSRGYLDAIDWHWIEGSVGRPGDAVVWMRPRVALVEGEEISPLQRLLACVDSASGAASALDITEWNFLNTDLTVHQLRPMVGEWVCLVAHTRLGPGSIGTAVADVYDERGLFGRSAQALLVAPVAG